ncbi:hypothetical protein Ddye_011915 [Dipteronia dyeriana]|uniref:Uncharacterized protein n=1 Tax=Dipteronia dyeriana TaxID=168575 RepID=A0AAE0CHU3_9ROSI|nr:hypothetical protein Ddye_011915 [Dipteronia dyeriana]
MSHGGPEFDADIYVLRSVEEMEKVVIVSSGIVYSENQKENYLGNIGRDISGILVSESPQDLRLLVSLAFFDYRFIKWSPDFILWEFINVSVLFNFVDLISGSGRSLVRFQFFLIGDA